MRFSLDEARNEADMGLKRRACSLHAADAAEAFDLARASFIEAPWASFDIVHGWDHGGASYGFRASEAHRGISDSNEVEPLIAATVCAAEIEVSRSYPSHLAEEHIF